MRQRASSARCFFIVPASDRAVEADRSDDGSANGRMRTGNAAELTNWMSIEKGHPQT